ncbi:hypothetical protein KSP39_PZI015284 [Platanthera zijinensis]|uniref:Uncharacterized protein n=1 Tax=Platanthera zijinensis TaxID=2320716 RepID=A0AAP0B859_9ASPA
MEQPSQAWSCRGLSRSGRQQAARPPPPLPRRQAAPPRPSLFLSPVGHLEQAAPAPSSPSFSPSRPPQRRARPPPSSQPEPPPSTSCPAPPPLFSPAWSSTAARAKARPPTSRPGRLQRGRAPLSPLFPSRPPPAGPSFSWPPLPATA